MLIFISYSEDFRSANLIKLIGVLTLACDDDIQRLIFFGVETNQIGFGSSPIQARHVLFPFMGVMQNRWFIGRVSIGLKNWNNLKKYGARDILPLF